MKLSPRNLSLKIALVIVASGLTGACGNSKFTGSAAVTTKSKDSSQATPEPASSTNLPNATTVGLSTQQGGVQGGHFDLDTSTSTYDFNKGRTDHHVHEYDDSFNTTGVDFLNLRDDKFGKPNSIIAAEQSFNIVVGNSSYSPGTMLFVNGKAFKASDWISQNPKPNFSFNGAEGTEKLVSFSVGFDPNKSIDGQLIATTTDLVRKNAPGPDASYRAGALTIQLLTSSSNDLDPAIGLAKVGSKSMLWEATLFYHKENSHKK